MWPSVAIVCIYLSISLSFLVLLVIMAVILYGAIRYSEHRDSRVNDRENR